MSEESKATGSEKIDLDGLFTLHPMPDGSFRAEFGRYTKHREAALQLGLDVPELDLLKALIFFACEPQRMHASIPHPPEPVQTISGDSNIEEIYEVGRNAKAHVDFLFSSVVSPFQAVFGNEIKILMNPDEPAPDRERAMKLMNKQFSRILGAFYHRSEFPKHGLSAQGTLTLADGSIRKMPAAWLLLYVARDLVQASRHLPSKGGLRWAFEDRYPELKKLSDRKWSDLWNITGLSGLDEVKPWEVIKKKKLEKMRARTKKD